LGFELFGQFVFFNLAEETSDKKLITKQHNQRQRLFSEIYIILPKYSNLSNLTLPIKHIIDGTTI